MGRLSLASFLRFDAGEEHPSWVTSKGKVESEHAEHVENIEILGQVAEDDGAEDGNPTDFPVLPKRVKDEDLPFIASSTVRKQDGQEGKRLCTHLLLHRTVTVLT